METDTEPKLVCRHNAYDGPEPGIQCTYHTQHGLKIVGNGTLQHPLTVEVSGVYAAAQELLESVDPDTLEAVADEISVDFRHTARADSLRRIARIQRAAIAQAEVGAQG